jgi:uncharacterized protein with NRDE domain
MCLIGIRIGEGGSLLLAANRDEFADRPTLAMHWWSEGLLAGKDLKAGGTWLGITRTGRFAAVTNVRDPSIKENSVPRPSRGHLVTEFLTGNTTPDAFADSLAKELLAPSPFNLIVGTLAAGETNAYWLGGRTREMQLLERGVHTLSNAELNTPWPKSRVLQDALQKLDHQTVMQSAYSARNGEQQNKVDALISGTDPHSVFDTLATIMRQPHQAPDHELPSTGVPFDWEKRLSAIHITGDRYHTRSTSIIRIRDGKVAAKEITWRPDGEKLSHAAETFEIE